MIKKTKERILDFWERTTWKLEFVSLLCTVVLIAIYIKYSGVFSGIWIEDVASCTIGILLLTVAIIICRKCRIIELVAGVLISIVILVIAPSVDMGQKVVALFMLCVSTFLAVHGFLRFCNSLMNRTEELSDKFKTVMEYRIYNNIGLEPENMFKKYRFELANNRKEPVFKKYSEWENYFTERYINKTSELKEFKFFLEQKKRVCQIILNVLDNLYLPIVVAEFSFLLGSGTEESIEKTTILFLLLLLTTTIATACMIKYNKIRHFYDECLKVIEETEKH